MNSLHMLPFLKLRTRYSSYPKFASPLSSSSASGHCPKEKLACARAITIPTLAPAREKVLASMRTEDSLSSVIQPYEDVLLPMESRRPHWIIFFFAAIHVARQSLVAVEFP